MAEINEAPAPDSTALEDNAGDSPEVPEEKKRPPLLPTRRVYVMQDVDPCFMPLTSGVIGVAVAEIVVYLAIFGFYIYFALDLFQSDDETIRGYWHHEQYYSEREEVNIPPEDTTTHIRVITIAEAVVSSIYVIISIALIIGALKRVASIACTWLVGVLFGTGLRIILLVLCPLPVFQFGLIWLIAELYFILVVTNFYYECKMYPNGLNYKGELAVEVPPVYGDPNGPPPGYPATPTVISTTG